MSDAPHCQGFVGIDIAAKTFTATWIPAGPTRPVTFDQTDEGYREFMERIQAVQPNPATVLIVLSSYLSSTRRILGSGAERQADCESASCLRSHLQPRSLVPALESVRTLPMVLLGTYPMSSRAAVFTDRPAGGEEVLGMTQRREAAQHPCGVPAFPLLRRLMRVFCTIIQAFVPSVLDAHQDLPLRCAITSKFVSDDHARHILAALRPMSTRFAAELLGGCLVTSALDEDIKDVPVLVNSAPEVYRFALDGQKHFVNMPRIARLRDGLKRSCGCKTTDHAAGHRDIDHRFAPAWETFIVLAQPATLRQPGECPLNGLIINDKFCLTRGARLHLNWPRAQWQGNRPMVSTLDYPLDASTHPGGSDETILACRTNDDSASECPAALGSRLSPPPAMGVAQPTELGTCAASPALSPAGGLPCA